MNQDNKIEELNITEAYFKLFQLLSKLRKKLFQIIIVTVISALLGLFYSIIKRPVYIAEMTFVAETEESNSLGKYAGIAAQFGMDMGGGNGVFEGDNLIELLKSNNIIRQTLLSTNPQTNEFMIERYIITHKIKKAIDENPKTRLLNFRQDLTMPHRLEDSILNSVYDRIVKNQLDISRKDKKLNYVIVTMRDKDENFAKNFIELLTKNAVNYYIDYKSKKARENLQLITTKTDSIRNILYGNLERINIVSDAQLLNVVRQTPRFDNQKSQANIQAHSVLYAELLKQLGLAQITAQKETPLIQIIDKPRLPLEVDKIGKLVAMVLFGFFGGMFFIFYILVKDWYKNIFTKTIKIVKENA